MPAKRFHLAWFLSQGYGPKAWRSQWPGTDSDIKLVREAIRRERKLRIAYVAETGAATERAIWPIAMAFYERRQTVAAWCELRGAFRHFRTDRITALTATAERYPRRRVELVEAWRRELNFSE